MEYRPIEVKLICGKDLKDVNVFSTMDVYVVGSVSGDPRSMQQTAVHKDGGTNPNWNHVMRFNVDESAARLNRLGLVFQIMSNRTLGDKEVGRVYVPLKELFDAVSDNTGEEKHVVYQVQTSTGRFKGQLEFSFKLGEKFIHTLDQKLEENALPIEQRANEPAFTIDSKVQESSHSTSNEKQENEPVIAYPPNPGPIGAQPRSHPEHLRSGSGSVMYPGPGYNNYGGPPPGTAPYNNNYGGPPPGPGYNTQQGYGPPPQGTAPYNNYGAPPPGYPYPPQQPPPNAQMNYGYGYGYPAGPSGYGSYPSQPSTGFAQPPPVKQHKKKGSKFGMGTAAGIGAGLLGGLLVGEMVEDVADAAVYDDIYDF